MDEGKSLKGSSSDIYRLVVNLIDEYLEEFPETPPQTVCAALGRVLELYSPKEGTESTTGGFE